LCQNNDNIEYRYYYYKTAFSHKIIKEAQSQRPLPQPNDDENSPTGKRVQEAKTKERKQEMEMFRRIKRVGSIYRGRIEGAADMTNAGKKNEQGRLYRRPQS
jgi:hypothetical protein